MAYNLLFELNANNNLKTTQTDGQAGKWTPT